MILDQSTKKAINVQNSYKTVHEIGASKIRRTLFQSVQPISSPGPCFWIPDFRSQ